MTTDRPTPAPLGGAAGPAADFDCLWCGRAWQPRSTNDIEAWARLCPDCLARAQDNAFLRSRLRAALNARAAASGGADARPGTAARAGRDRAAAPETAPEASTPPAHAAAADAIDAEMLAYYAARAAEYDDWYLRRGRYSHGPIHDMAWQADLDAASRWLDALPWRGEIVELAAGTGWWSPLLASKGTLWLYDANAEPLERARDRLIAHGLRAHIHVRDVWAEPDRQVGGVFAGFWLSHVARERLGEFLSLAGRWLEPGGLLALIDSRQDRQSGARDHAAASATEAPNVPDAAAAPDALDVPEDDIQVRRLADGSAYRVRKVFYQPDELCAALEAAGFVEPQVTVTSRFFLLASARKGGGTVTG